MTVLPSWSIILDNAEELHGSWIIGTTHHQHKVEELMDEYCRSLPCDFVKRHPSNVWKSKKPRLLWKTKDLSYSGVPFIVVSHNLLVCTFTMNYNSEKRRKTARCQVSILCDGDESTSSSEVYNNCPANIIVKKIRRYPSCGISATATTQERLIALKALKSDLDGGVAPKSEVVFWVRLPLPRIHNHAFHGKDRLTHPNIRDKILDLACDGENTATIMTLLNNHVKQQFKGSINPPGLDDQAYYPSFDRVKHILYNYISRKKRKKNTLPNASCSTGEEAEQDAKWSMQTVDAKPNILQQDVVQTPHSNSAKTTTQTPSVFPQSQVVKTEQSVTVTEIGSSVVELKAEVGEKIAQLSKLTESLNDSKKLKALLDCLNRLPVIVDDGGINDCTYNFYPLCPISNILSEVVYDAPVSENQSGNCSQYSIEPVLNCAPDGESQYTFETNQIVPTHTYSDFAPKDMTYIVMNNAATSYPGLDDALVRSAQDNFPPLLSQVQSFPVIANDTAHYPCI